MAVTAFITRFTGISGYNRAAYAACRALFGSGGGVGRNTAGISIGTGFGAYATVAALYITTVTSPAGFNGAAYTASRANFSRKARVCRFGADFVGTCGCAHACT